MSSMSPNCLEKKLTELSYEMETAASDFARVQALGDEYTQTEDELARAWDEFERIA